MVTEAMTFLYLFGILAVIVIAVAFLELKKADLSKMEDAADDALDDFLTSKPAPPADLFEEPVEEVKEVKEVTPEVKELVKELVAEPVAEVPAEIKEPVTEVAVGVAPKKKKKKYIKPKPKQ